MGDIFDKAAELRECAAAWEPGVRLLGNVRADEIIGILAAYEARIAELEAMLSDEVAENVRLRSREVGDEVGNLLQEVADLKNELAHVKAESLRVVKDGGIKSFLFACEDQREYVKWNGKVCRIDSLQEGVDVVGENRNYPIANAIGVQPVRLERWEDEE